MFNRKQLRVSKYDWLIKMIGKKQYCYIFLTKTWLTLGNIRLGTLWWWLKETSSSGLLDVLCQPLFPYQSWTLVHPAIHPRHYQRGALLSCSDLRENCHYSPDSVLYCKRGRCRKKQKVLVQGTASVNLASAPKWHMLTFGWRNSTIATIVIDVFSQQTCLNMRGTHFLKDDLVQWSVPVSHKRILIMKTKHDKNPLRRCWQLWKLPKQSPRQTVHM